MKKNIISKRFRAVAGLSAAIAGASVMTISTFTAAPVMAETTAAEANITKDKAKTIAFNHAKATAAQVTGYKIEVDRERNATFYEIDFKYNGYEYEYKINSATGSIVEWDKEPIKGYKKPTATTPTTTAKPTVSSKPATTAADYIGEVKAKNTALSHAKLSADKITGYKIKLDNEKGVAYYDIEFRSGNYDYDYDINAKTGAIIKSEKELDIDSRNEGYVLYKDNKWHYAKNGRIDRSYTGVARSTTGNWVFVRNGVYDNTYTGVARSTTGNWVFVKNGRFNMSYTGVARSTTGNWVFVKNGRFDMSYTGVARSTTGNWVYVLKGRYSDKATGVARSITGNFVYVRNGKFNTSFTGVTKSLTTGDWIYVKNGRYYTGFTGNAKTADGKTMYVVKGRVR